MNSVDSDVVRRGTPTAPTGRGRALVRTVAVLCGLAAVVLALTWLLPASRWLSRMQLSGWRWPEDGSPVYPVTVRDLERAAAAAPQDGETQAAMIAWKQAARGGQRAAVSDSRHLADRFPNNPAVLAAALRMARAGRARRQPAETASLIGIAERGAKLDPRNAFFPLTRASLLLSANRDSEALASLEEAAALPRWNEYVVEEIRAAWRLSDAASGGPNTAMRALMALDGNWSWPPFDAYADERLSRLAADADRAGRAGDAYRIRRALMRVGARMRDDSATFTGAVVGLALQRAAADHLLDGQRPEVRSDTGKRRAAYDAFLRRAGHPADIAWTHRQQMTDDAVERVLFRFGGRARRDAASPFKAWYRAGWLLLRTAFWLALAAGVLALLNRWRFARRVIGGYREAALLAVTAASLCAIAYGYVTIRTLDASALANRNLSTMIENVPRYRAALTGHAWPP
jgi:hypothetical protein